MTISFPTTSGDFIPFMDAYSQEGKHGYAYHLAADIAAGLSDNGWLCHPLALWENPSAEVARMIRNPPPFVMNFNLVPTALFVDLNYEGGGRERLIFNDALSRVRRVPVISVLCDHAAHVMKEIVKYDYSSNRISFAVLEPSSIPFLERAGVPRARIVVLPWGGPATIPRWKPFKDRAYDIIFQGSLSELSSAEDFVKKEAAAGVPLPAAHAALDAAEVVVEQNETPDQAIQETLAEAGLNPAQIGIVQISGLVAATDLRSRTIRRERFLTAFAGLPVHFFGDYPADFQRRFSRAVFHGKKPFQEMLDVARNAKMALCEMINLRENVHMRLPYAVSSGCLAIAEKNLRLGRDFTDMENIIFSSNPYKDVADKVRTILADSRLGQDMIDAARPIYEARYTWRTAVKALAPLLPPPVAPPPRLARSPAAGVKPAKAKPPKVKPTKAKRGAKPAPKARSRRAPRP
ncbi:MAG: glycosyltransferase family 1 protein [Rhodospirillales bacterium]|nr:glycosyltransferase family 1 protein [Rhodospirillales bacterium]